LHVGSIRSGLSNWLWARHNGGVSVLRIEDTDRARFVEGAIDQINDSMESLGITPDEGPRQGGKYGPYLQSERLDIYKEHAEKLLATGALYRCWCTPERLDALRTAAQKAGTAFKYDRHCLVPENQGKESEPHVLRFRIPENPDSIGWDDAVRGRLDFKLTDLDDFVAIKADQYPTYHFANVVDDHLMEISHVMRADEWLPSTPKHLLMFVAFGWDAPIYAHLPAVLGPTGNKKLSKRDGAQSVQEYLDEGYLPEALRSFLASLGWNDGTTQEVYTTEELIKNFTLDRIQKSPAKFDKDRLTWMNGLLIRQMSLQELEQRCDGFWPTAAADTTPTYRQRVLGLVQERLKFLSELSELTEFFFSDPATEEIKDNLPKKLNGEPVKHWLEESIEHLIDYFPNDKSYDSSVFEDHFRHELAQNKLELEQAGPFFMLLRVSLTGKTATPGLFEMMSVLGAATVRKRLETALKILS
jgi:glutamyl-tRNA synthetase